MASTRAFPIILPSQTYLKAPCSTTSPLSRCVQRSSIPFPPRQLFPPRQCRWSSSSIQPPSSKRYTFEDIKTFVSNPSPDRILIDVREPAELRSSGQIPTARNIPVASSPDGLFLPAEDFEEKFGFQKPSQGDEVIFYCKAGVRSRAAAGMVMQGGEGGDGKWEGVKVGEYPGSWLDWERKGGAVEKK